MNMNEILTPMNDDDDEWMHCLRLAECLADRLAIDGMDLFIHDKQISISSNRWGEEWLAKQIMITRRNARGDL